MNPVPSSYVEFVTEWLGVTLTPAQRVLCLVGFDGAEPGDLVGEERELARKLFGEVDTIPKIARNVLAVIIGGRSGKTYLFSLRILHLGLTIDLSTLAPGEYGVGLIVAPRMELAQQAMNFVRGAVQSNESLRQWVTADTAESLDIKRWDGNEVSIRPVAASRGGTSARGKSLFAALLDEACFFLDANYTVNDEEIFKATQPRVIPGGQLLMPSTPWTEAGLLYTIWRDNLGNPRAVYVAAHAPTLLMTRRADGTYFRNTDQIIAVERLRDPENAEREFDAVPVGAEATQFFDPKVIESCIDESLDDVTAPTGLWHETTCGLDTAFRKDSSSAVILRAMDKERALIIVAECVSIRPERGEFLKPSETLAALIGRAVYHKATTVLADQHYIETVREHTESKRLGLREAPADNVLPYIAARTAMKEGRIKISPKHIKLLSQLREVRSKPTSGGKLSVFSPRKNGSHGDEVSAFVLAACDLLGEHVRVGEVTAAPEVKGDAKRVTEGYGAGRGQDREALKIMTPIHEREKQKSGASGRIGKKVWG